jgi:spore germination protein GerM
VSRLRRDVRVALALGLVALLGAAGCGVDTDDEPRIIPQDESAADEPIENSPTTSTEDVLAPRPGRRAQVYFTQARDGETTLVRANRTVPPPVTEVGLLTALLNDPPGPAERADGLITSIPETTELAAPPERQDGGVLNIRLNESIFEVEGDALRLAFGQLVCTATSLDTVRRVTFEVDGVPSPAVDGEGRETNGPVSCDEYETLLAPEG